MIAFAVLYIYFFFSWFRFIIHPTPQMATLAFIISWRHHLVWFTKTHTHTLYKLIIVLMFSTIILNRVCTWVRHATVIENKLRDSFCSHYNTTVVNVTPNLALWASFCVGQQQQQQQHRTVSQACQSIRWLSPSLQYVSIQETRCARDNLPTVRPFQRPSAPCALTCIWINIQLRAGTR